MEAVTRIRIFNRDYDIRSSDPEFVRKLGNLLHLKMLEVAGETATVDTTKVAILAALNIAGELMTTQQELEALRGTVQTRSRKMLEMLAGEKDSSPAVEN